MAFRLRELIERATRFWLSDAPAPKPVRVLALALAVAAGLYVTRDVWRAHAPASLPADDGDKRFGLSLSERRTIFTEFAQDEPRERAAGHDHFSEAWSAEDDRAAGERDKALGVAAEHGVHLTQVYLVLDEGIRARWLGPGGAPLDAATVPLKPRKR